MPGSRDYCQCCQIPSCTSDCQTTWWNKAAGEYTAAILLMNTEVFLLLFIPSCLSKLIMPSKTKISYTSVSAHFGFSDLNLYASFD